MGNKEITDEIVKLIKERYNINNNSIKGTSYSKYLKTEKNITDAATPNLTDNIAALFGRNKKDNTIDQKAAIEANKLLIERVKLNEMVNFTDAKKPMPLWLKITLITLGVGAAITAIILIVKHNRKQGKEHFSDQQLSTGSESSPVITS